MELVIEIQFILTPKPRLFPLHTIFFLKIVNIIILGVGLKVENIFPGLSRGLAFSLWPQRTLFAYTPPSVFHTCFFLGQSSAPARDTLELYSRNQVSWHGQGVGRLRWEQNSLLC